MKRIFLLFLFAPMFFSCNNNQTDKTAPEKEQTAENADTKTAGETQPSTFDINTIPYTNKDIGEFPFFTLPKGLKDLNKPLQKKFDVCFFPVNGVMTPFEGRLYKSNITAERGEEYSKRYFEKSLEDYLISLGAVKVFDGEISKEEYERYNKSDNNKGDEGDIGYAGQQIKFFVIRTKDKGNIYVQFTSTSAGGALNILQEESFKQTITKVTSEAIASDLLEKGKSVLHINFDTDKATLQPDGLALVQEIVKLLNSHADWKISINGYTDNAGSKEHNQTLSENRALTVKNEIAKAGISADRLDHKGFGQDSPLATNDTEEGKAQNRRVELVKR